MFSIITAFETNPNSVTNLSKLCQLTFAQCVAFLYTFTGEDDVQSDVVPCLILQATFQVNDVSIDAVISVYSSYPVRPSVFQLSTSKASMHKKKKSVNGTIDVSDLHLIEAELNRHYDELLQPLKDSGISAAYLLNCQMRRLQMCLDVVAGGESATSLPGRARRGKDRRPALKFDGETNTFMHR